MSCPLPLSEDQRERLVQLAVRAWFEDATELALNEEEFKATVRPTSDTVLLGTFVGQRFSAEVALPTCQGTVSFLVAEAQLRGPRGEIGEA